MIRFLLIYNKQGLTDCERAQQARGSRGGQHLTSGSHSGSKNLGAPEPQKPVAGCAGCASLSHTRERGAPHRTAGPAPTARIFIGSGKRRGHPTRATTRTTTAPLALASDSDRATASSSPAPAPLFSSEAASVLCAALSVSAGATRRETAETERTRAASTCTETRH